MKMKRDHLIGLRKESDVSISKQPAKRRIGAAGKDRSALKVERNTVKKYEKRAPDKNSR